MNSAVQANLRRLPKDIESPIISKSNPDDNPVLWIALKGTVPLRELMSYALNSVRDRLSTVAGVSDVLLAGYADPLVRVWLDVDKLRSNDLTHQDIVNSIRSEHMEIPVGRMAGVSSEKNVRLLGEAVTLDELAKVPIVMRGGQPIYRRIFLNELSRLEKGLSEIRRVSRTDGTIAVAMGIKKQPNANAVQVAKNIKARIKEISLPEGMTLSVNFDSTREIEKSVRELNITLLLSVFLTALVCWVFLGSLATTFNIVLAIPVSLAGAFIVFQFLGYTLNSFTMLALILSVGIIVDDAIVVLENIIRVRKTVPDSKQSARIGAEQVQFAAVATSVSLIAIFLPILFVDGIVGAFFAQFAVAMSVAIAWSTLEALTFTPMRMASFRAAKRVPKWIMAFDRFIEGLATHYAGLVDRLFSSSFKGAWVYPVAIVCFGSSLFLIKSIPKEIAPSEDTGVLFARVELPLGTNLDEPGRRLVPLEDLLRTNPNIERLYTTVGGFGGSLAVNTGVLFVTLKPKELREGKKGQEQIVADLRTQFKESLKPDMKIFIQGRGGLSLGTGRRGFDLDLKLKGSNWAELVANSKAFVKALSEDKSFQDVNSSFNEGAPELALIPDRSNALNSMISVGDISETLAFLFKGIPAAKFNDDGHRVDILVQADPKPKPLSQADFSRIHVRNAKGILIPLNTLVSYKEQFSSMSIGRENRERSITVSANLAKGVFLDSGIEQSRAIASKVLSGDARLDNGGTSGDLSKTLSSLAYAFGFGILVAYMVLASQFNSLKQPLIILLSMPFSLTGAFLSMWIFGKSISIYSMIGIILLVGIVVKNGILLVEFANQSLQSGKTVREAVLEACRTRLRPILMTAFTTLSAALIPAFKIGIESEASSAMGIVILGGLSLSTFVTLFLVPLAYFHWVRQDHYKAGMQ